LLKKYVTANCPVLYPSRQLKGEENYYKDMLNYGVINRQVVGATGSTTINYHTTICKLLFCNNIEL